MKYITEITRQDIIDIIKNGFNKEVNRFEDAGDYGVIEIFDHMEEVKMYYWGRLNEISFLQRLYPLDKMPSHDRRYTTALGDIRQHTENNDDWDYCWVFTDERFCLSNGNEDEPLLKFLCEMLHPVVRDDKKPWKDYLDKFNEILYNDGYELFEKKHISGRVIYGFRRIDSIEINMPNEKGFAELKTIGSGSYAVVSKYYDKHYDKWFALKKAKKDLDEKEIQRFRREFDDMKKLNSPYIIEVYSYDENKQQYIMELADSTLEKYINDNNSSLSFRQRQGIVAQIFKAFEYMHSKGFFHRDISPRNVLVKKFEDNTVIIKISDFGLAKENNSQLTSDSSVIKGCYNYNDPNLRIVGFGNYNLIHETYALTQLIVFVITGKNNFDKIKNQSIIDFLYKGMNPDKNQRFQSINEMRSEFAKIGSN